MADIVEENSIEIGGHTFTHRPYTRANKERFEEKIEEVEPRIRDTGDDFDEFDYWYAVLPVIAEGPVEEVGPEDISGREFDDFMMAFLPESKRTYARLIGY